MTRKRWRFIGRTWESWVAYFGASYVAVKLIWGVWGMPDAAWWKVLLVYMALAAIVPKDLGRWFEKS